MDATTGSDGTAGTGRNGVARSAGFSIVAGALALASAVGLAGAGPASALAQDAAEAPVRSITTNGYGEAAAPAESATMQLLITREDFGPPRPPRPSATPGAEERELTTPVVDALIDAGLTEEDIEVVLNPVVGQYFNIGGPGIARIDVAVDEPTQERILELINAAVPVAAQQGVLIGQVGVGYNVEDCLALERVAREDAVGDARDRAAIQAELLAVELGEAVASADVPPSESSALLDFGRAISSEAGCAPPAPSITEGNSVNLPPFDPAGEAEVEVFAQVAITFEVGEAAA